MMDYLQGKGIYENWIVSELEFSPYTLGKSEAIMYLGNGYMGMRSATEEPYINETRNLFVSGTFNKAQENEVTELPNLADVTRLDIRVDGERFSLEFGKTTNYSSGPAILRKTSSTARPPAKLELLHITISRVFRTILNKFIGDWKRRGLTQSNWLCSRPMLPMLSASGRSSGTQTSRARLIYPSQWETRENGHESLGWRTVHF